MWFCTNVLSIATPDSEYTAILAVILTSSCMNEASRLNLVIEVSWCSAGRDGEQNLYERRSRDYKLLREFCHIYSQGWHTFAGSTERCAAEQASSGSQVLEPLLLCHVQSSSWWMRRYVLSHMCLDVVYSVFSTDWVDTRTLWHAELDCITVQSICSHQLSHIAHIAFIECIRITTK